MNRRYCMVVALALGACPPVPGVMPRAESVPAAAPASPQRGVDPVVRSAPAARVRLGVRARPE